MTHLSNHSNRIKSFGAKEHYKSKEKNLIYTTNLINMQHFKITVIINNDFHEGENENNLYIVRPEILLIKVVIRFQFHLLSHAYCWTACYISLCVCSCRSEEKQIPDRFCSFHNVVPNTKSLLLTFIF